MGDSDVAVVSAVHQQFVSTQFHVISVAHMASQIGRCATFDAEADGYAPGEGCISIILKRLDDAVTDHDHIYGVITGITTSQSGIRPSISSPAVGPQVENIQKALQIANVSPADVDYVEAHGTGTQVGDAIETETLNIAFGGTHNAKKPLIVGSVKTNIGHTEEVSGLAGLCKVLLSMSHRTIPPHLHLKNLNPRIDTSVIPMTIPQKKCIWKSPRGKKRVGVVSSFGLQGSVANAVIEEFKLPKNTDRRLDEGYDLSMYHILTVSAKNKNALIQQVEDYISLFESMNEDDSIADICYSSNIGRQHFGYRYSAYGRNASEIIESLTDILQRVSNVRRYLQKSTAFAFTGQGVAKVGMGKHFYQTQPVFREAMDRCDAVTRRLLGVSIVEVLYNVSNIPNGTEEGEKALKKSSVAQPALFAYEYAMSQLWISWGIKPSMVLGHSLGEIVATTIAGGIDFELAMEFIVERASCMEKYGIKPGAMVSIFTTEDVVKEAIEEFEFENVSIAAINGTTQIVISGNADEVKELEEYFIEQDIKAKQLNVTEAFHSALMDPAIEKLYEWIDSKPDEKFRQPLKYGLISNVTGKLIPAGERLPKNYWGEHARNAVQFVKAVETLLANSETLLNVIEVGPASVLTNMSSRILREKKVDKFAAPFFVASALPREPQEEKALFEAVSKVYNVGMDINWRVFHTREDIYTHVRPTLKKVTLPLYPFQRSRYWAGPDTTKYDIPYCTGVDTRELANNIEKAGYVIDGDNDSNEVKQDNDNLDIAISEGSKNWNRYETPTVIDLDHLEGSKVVKSAEESSCIISVPLSSPYIHYLRKSHVINGKGFSPATSFIDFVFYGLKFAYPNDQFKINEYFITNGPLSLSYDHDVVYIMVKKGEEITIYSQTYGGQQEMRGSVIVSVANSIDSEKATDELGFDVKKDYVEKYLSGPGAKDSSNYGEGKELYEEMDKSLVYGSFFRSVQSFYSGKEQDGTEFLISHIKHNVKQVEESLVNSGASQVGILDAAIHCMSGDGIVAKKNGVEGSKDSFLPTSFEGIIKYKEIPNEVYVLHRVKSVNETSKFTQYWVFDVDGKLVFSTDNFQVKKFDISKLSGNREFRLSFTEWEELPVKRVVNENVHVIVLKDKKGYADAFIKAFKDRNIPGYIVGVDLPLSEEPNAAFAHIYPTIKAKRTAEGVLALYNFSLLDAEEYNGKETAEELVAKYKDLYTQCIEYTKAFIRTSDEMKFKKDIQFVTMGASKINTAESSVGPIVSVARGILKNLNHEMLDLHGCLFDLEVGTSVDVAANYCLDELLGGVDRYDMPVNVSYRNGKRMTPVLTASDNSYERCEREELVGNILITGGLGDVSMDVVNSLLADKDSKLEHIFLLGRSSKTNSRVIEKLARIEKVRKDHDKNIQIEYYSCDISDESSLAEVFNDIRKRQGLQITGIFHTAGVNSDANFLSQSYEKLVEIAPSKIIGTHNIMKLSEEFKDELKFVVFVSSLSAVSGNGGQTNYTAANMFIDALARYYNDHGRTNVIAIELGGWKGAGSSDQLVNDFMVITSEAGFNMFKIVFTANSRLNDRVYTVIPERSYDKCDEYYFHDYLYIKYRPRDRPRQDLTTITREGAYDQGELDAKKKSVTKDNIPEILKEEVRRMLMYNENDELDIFQPLSELGIDSIMMMELRQIIKAVTNITVPLSIITTPNLTLSKIFEYLKGKMNGNSGNEKSQEKSEINEKPKTSVAAKREALRAKKAQRKAAAAAIDFDNLNDYGDWIVRLDTNKDTTNSFFLIPAAGSSINMYNSWSKYMNKSALFAISYPGHLARIDETPIDDFKVLVKSIGEEILNNIKNGKISKDKPIYFFGHSLGALVSYETVLYLQNERKKGNPNAPVVTALVVSASPSPVFPRPITIKHDENGNPVHFTDLAPEELPAFLTNLGGANKDSMSNNKQFQKLIPSIVADFKLTDEYRRFTDKDHQLECALYDIGGISDPIISVASRSRWDLENAEGYPIVRIEFEGDHWFF